MKTVVEMARESWLDTYGLGKDHASFVEAIERFAELVRADEREACAKVAQSTVCDTHIPTGVKIYGTAAAKAIRARGETK